MVAPAVAAGQAVGHIGCLIGGDSYGLPTDGPLAVIYQSPNAVAPQGVPLHPTQLYEAVSLGILAVVLWVSRGRLERFGPGATAAVYLAGNAAIPFSLCFLRDDVIVFAGLRVAQLIAIGIALAGVTWLLAGCADPRWRRVPNRSHLMHRTHARALAQTLVVLVMTVAAARGGSLEY